MSTATAKAAPAQKRGAGLFQGLQKVGRSLQLPIAVLPAAVVGSLRPEHLPSPSMVPGRRLVQWRNS
ncbi:hypothetical protein [Streptomyces rhizosphaericus]|uniref:hypothetical protein n=1 Tax=Streptomyces rhizosphaericus TaxID=114699 RepID=UPI0035D4B2B6